MSMKALCASISPENMRWNSRSASCLPSVSRSVATAPPTSASFSARASSSSSCASLRRLSSFSITPNSSSRRARSRPKSWARCGLFQMPGCSSSARTTRSRSCLVSKSKRPPQRSENCLQLTEAVGQKIEVLHGGKCRIRLPRSIHQRPREGQPAESSKLDAEHLADDAPDMLDRLRRLDVHHLLQHPLVVGRGHGRRYLVAKVTQKGIARPR